MDPSCWSLAAVAPAAATSPAAATAEGLPECPCTSTAEGLPETHANNFRRFHLGPVGAAMVAAADAALTKAIRPRFIRGLLFLSEIVGFGRFRPGSGGKPICYFDLASVRARFRLAGKPHNRPSGPPKAGRRAEVQGFPIRIQAKSGPHGLARTLAGQGPTGGPLASLPTLA